MQDRLLAKLQTTSREFLDGPTPSTEKSDIRALNEWYESAEGQEILASLLQDMAAMLFHRSESAMPAHDARHALLKVPASAVEWACSEEVDPWERVGVIGAFLHDYGRWSEERIFGAPCASVVHARMGFVLAKEILGQYPLPFEMRQHILLSVLRHTAGATPDDPMPLKLVVTADREQLYGPEMVLRLVHHMPQDNGDMAHLQFDTPGLSVLSHLEHFLRNRQPGPLYSRLEHTDYLRELLCTFVMLCESRAQSMRRFGPENGDAASTKKRIETLTERPFDWRFEYDLAQWSAPEGDVPLSQALSELLDARWVAPASGYKAAVLAKSQDLDELAQRRWSRALRFAREMREQEDHRQKYALQQISRDPRNDRFLRASAGLLHGYF
jgi:hypothetical protein